MVIDNGNHLVLSGNREVRRYLATIGAADRLVGPEHARFAFVDLRDGRRWTIRANDGIVPWWMAAKGRRVPGTTIADYLPLAGLVVPGEGTIKPFAGPAWEMLIAPFLLAALNTPPAQGSARLAAAVVRGSLARGGRAYRPLVAAPSLSAAFVDPALAWLERRGATVRFGRRLRGLVTDDRHATALEFADGGEPVGAGEPVVIATPGWTAATLLPGLVVPDAHEAIVNAHFRLEPPPGAEPLVGVIGGTAEWIFAFPDRLSVTISAAGRLLDEDRAALATRLWEEVAAVHRLASPLPPWQIVSEKRATFAATPEQDRRRPPAATQWRNLLLAGDWTQTGLPATIEGAIRSGRTAARLATAMGSA